MAPLRQPTPSTVFRSDPANVYTKLPVPSAVDLQFLGDRFKKWRESTQDFVRDRLAELDKDDPLKCPISLFRTMDYGRLETAHTRVLAWLLDPEAEHGFGTALLAPLLRRAGGGDHSDVLRVERVAPEFMIGTSEAMGRLDVVAEGTWEGAEGGGWLLVIEAKVGATEGEGQLDKYDKWIEFNAGGRKPYRIFLTPQGRKPEGGCEEWTALSFLELVKTFRKVYADLVHSPGFHFLRFYLAGVLHDVCHLPRKVGEDAADPYAAASYLKAVHEFPLGGSKP